MKVAHLCQSADSRIGGSGAVARDLVAKQVERGIDARLVYLYRGPDAAADPHRARVPSIYLGVDRSNRYTTGVTTLRHALRDFGPDVVHHHDGLLWTRLVTPGLGVPLVTHGHSEAPRSWGKRALQRFALRGTRQLLAVSDWTAQSWVDAGFPPDRISVVPNGVDCVRFARRPDEARRAKLADLGIDPAMRVLLWAGRLERTRKGLDRLLNVGRKIPDDWACVIAGDGTDREWLSSEVEKLSSRARFRMLGNVDDPEEWFGVADAYLFTSPIEPFGLVILEAAASGLPIIGFRCEGGGMELLEELGADIIDENDDAKVGLVFRSIPAPERAARGRRIVEESYSWAAVADKTISIYRELTT